MRYSTTVTIEAAAERACALLAEIRQWPSWTPTVETLESDCEQPVEGCAVRIKQPGRGITIYTVDVVEPGRRFRWGSQRAGITQHADHVVIADGDNRCTVDLSFEMSGPVGAILGRLGAGKIRSMVDTEAASLRQHLTHS